MKEQVKSTKVNDNVVFRFSLLYKCATDKLPGWNSKSSDSTCITTAICVTVAAAVMMNRRLLLAFVFFSYKTQNVRNWKGMLLNELLLLVTTLHVFFVFRTSIVPSLPPCHHLSSTFYLLFSPTLSRFQSPSIETHRG